MDQSHKFHFYPRNKPKIHITQMADEIPPFIRDKLSLEKILSLLHKFHQHAGLNLNKEKTEALLLGNSNRAANP